MTSKMIRTGKRSTKSLYSISIICLVFICSLILTDTQFASATYDPESTIDEIPIISARSLTPEISGRYEAHRRNSEPDLEEVDDYDDDDRQRGSSSNIHDTYENPAYGESRRSAREGDDIERFFDRHIGPSANDIANGGDADDGSASSNGDLPLLAPDTSSKRSASDDPFEMAASSPLATIFQTLIAAHKRPIVIETNDLTAELGVSEGNKPDDSSSSSSTLTGASTSTTASSQPSIAALGPSSPALAMAPTIASYLSPIAAPSSLAAYGQQMMEQAAAMGGVAMGASGYAVQGVDQAASGGNGDDGSSSQEDDGSGAIGGGGGQIQEIYIGRRPTLMNHFQSYSPSNKKLSHQSSNANYWRGALPASSMGVQQSSRAQMGYHPMMSNEQMSSAHNSDYSRYPVAASYAHQQESADQGGDEGTVEYNLSFGGSGGDSGGRGSGGAGSGPDDSEEMSSLSVDSQSASDEAPASQPQMGHPFGRQRPTSTNQYMTFNPYHPEQSQQQFQQQLQQQYIQQQQQHHLPPTIAYNKNDKKKGKWPNNGGSASSSSGREPQHQATQQHKQKLNQIHNQSKGVHRQIYHPARYHKDPSESVVQPINYGQFRPSQTPEMMLMNQQQSMMNPYRAADQQQLMQKDRTGQREWLERQNYLEMLDREIKSSPRYEQQQQEQQQQQHKMQSSSNNRKKIAKRKNPKSDEADDEIYSNIQSESTNPTRVYQQQQTQPLTTTSNHNDPQQLSIPASSSATKNHIDSQIINSNHQLTTSPSLNNNNGGNVLDNVNNSTSVNQKSIDNQWIGMGSSNYMNTQMIGHSDQKLSSSNNALRNTNNDVITISVDQEQHPSHPNQVKQQSVLSRVKRQDDIDDRDDADDDGVWVDDDDDDDNNRQSSDVNETSQEPEDDASGDDQGGDESGQQSSYNVQPVSAQVSGISLNSPGGSGYITRPHSYEISPDDSYAYAYPG